MHIVLRLSHHLLVDAIDLYNKSKTTLHYLFSKAKVFFGRIRAQRSGGPGYPQKRIFSINTSSLILWSLLFFSLFLIIHSIFRENNIKHPNLTYVLKIKISDISTSSALFSAVLALIAVNRQQQLIHRPILNFKPRSFPSKPIREGFDLPADFRYQCSIVNQGLGMCIFEKIEYLIQFWPHIPSNLSAAEAVDYDRLIELLHSIQLVPEMDFTIFNMRNGSCLQTGGEYTCLDANKRFVTSVRFMRLNMYFRSLLGERYYKEIDIVPEKGIMALRFSSLFHLLESGMGDSLS